MRRVPTAAFLCLLSSQAMAQCPPTNSTPALTAGGSVFGRIAAQWNQYFGAKLDANGGIGCAVVLHNLPTPVSPGDAANKAYVDANAGSTGAANVTTIIASGGTIAVSSAQSTINWKPTVPASTSFGLPASPGAAEVHTFKDQAPSGYAMTITPGSGQTIDNEPSWALVVPNDTVSVQYDNVSNWMIVTGVGGSH